MEKAIVFNYQARYSKIGSLELPESELWFVLHGYGQLSPYFIKKFEFLADQGHCVVAPEGLNRFYLKGFSGRVGATWMTTEGREDDIENYLNYLNNIYYQEVGQRRDIVINLLGFSQGTATIGRWIAQSDIEYHRLFIWAGMLPPDLHMDTARPRFFNKPIYFVYGTKDVFITKGRLAGHHKVAEDLGINPELHTFDGEHDIDPETLMNIVQPL